jgi:S-adenosylmethionine:tRNA ribosyltransferase-isomerase
MKLSDFNYNLPKELIAQYPNEERDNCRLMVLDRNKKTIEHRTFRDILEYVRKDDLFILNDTKVLPARLMGKRLSGARVEVLLIGPKNGLRFHAMMKPSRLKAGEKIIFNGAKSFGLISGRNEITFDFKDVASIYKLGIMPLPPYIKREAQDLDRIYYQTVYAREEGAIAAPTAGLHFTKELIEKMESFGINFAHLTLHVGVATFKPVKDENVTGHKMEPEYFKIPQETVKEIEKTRKAGSKIVTVGTTSLRALETYAQGKKEGDTDLFIYPGYKFKITGGLLTNFHLPKTTLFMLVCAFAGEKLIKQAYQVAIDQKYGFYSYGDAMLII